MLPSHRCPAAWESARQPTRRRKMRTRSIAAASASCSSGGTNGGEMSRNTRSATPRSARRPAAAANVATLHALVQPFERDGVRRLQPHRDLERRVRAGSSNRSTRGPTSDGCDSTITRSRPVSARATAPVIRFRHRSGIKEASGVVHLHLSNRFSSRLESPVSPM